MSLSDDLEAEVGPLKAKSGPKKSAGNGHSDKSWFDIVNAIPVRDVLDWLGIEYNESGHVNCPKCGNYDSSSAIYENAVKCLHDTCSGDGPTSAPGLRSNVDLVMLVHGVEKLEAVKE